MKLQLNTADKYDTSGSNVASEKLTSLNSKKKLFVEIILWQRPTFISSWLWWISEGRKDHT